MESRDFTLYVKNYITFPNFGVTRRNIPNNSDTICIYHPTRDPLCPIFVVKDVVRLAGEDFNALARTVSFIQTAGVCVTGRLLPV